MTDVKFTIDEIASAHIYRTGLAERNLEEMVDLAVQDFQSEHPELPVDDVSVTVSITIKHRPTEVYVCADIYYNDDPLNWNSYMRFLSNMYGYYNDRHVLTDRHGDAVYDEDGEPLSFDDLEHLNQYLDDHNYVTVDVYIYKHGGETISTTPFSASWDSGRFGILYMSPQDIIDMYGTYDRATTIQAIKYMENFVNNIWRKVFEGEVYVIECGDDTIGGVIIDVEDMPAYIEEIFNVVVSPDYTRENSRIVFDVVGVK